MLFHCVRMYDYLSTYPRNKVCSFSCAAVSFCFGKLLNIVILFNMLIVSCIMFRFGKLINIVRFCQIIIWITEMLLCIFAV